MKVLRGQNNSLQTGWFSVRMSFWRVTPARRNATATTFIAAKSNFRDRTEIEHRLKVLFSSSIRIELLKAATTLRTVGDNKRRRVASRLKRLNAVTSAHDLRFGGAGQAPKRHRYLRPLGLQPCVAACMISRPSQASELALGRSAVAPLDHQPRVEEGSSKTILGHRNIQHTVRYAATKPASFERLWR
jgi:hypothetical protein